MKFINVTELRAQATAVVRSIEETGEDVVITKNGKPVALIQAIDDSNFELKEIKGKEVKKNGKS